MQTLQVDNPVVTNLRDLFKKIDKSQMIALIHLDVYISWNTRLCKKYDARGCLSHILENSYTTDELKDECFQNRFYCYSGM